MKHKMTITLIMAFVLISGCALLGALYYPNRSVKSAEAGVSTEITEKTALSEDKSVSEGITTELTEIAKTGPISKKQLKLAGDNDAGGTVQKKEESSGTVQSATTEKSNAKEATEAPATALPSTTAAPTTEAPVRKPENPTTTEPRREDTTTEEKKPQSTTETPTTAEPTTEKKRVWHPEVTKEVWVVDVPAYTETITYTDYIDCYLCPNCGATFATYDEADQHLMDSVNRYLQGEIDYYSICVNFRTWQTPVERTENFEHPEEGHWETVVVSEGYWE